MILVILIYLWPTVVNRGMLVKLVVLMVNLLRLVKWDVLVVQLLLLLLLLQWWRRWLLLINLVLLVVMQLM